MKDSKYSVYIVDDNQSCIDRLADDLKNYPDYHLAGSSIHLMSAISDITSHDIDLLFLDVEMPEGSGFDFIKILDNYKLNLKIVIYSAFDKYVIDALRASAFDFLQKPYTSDELNTVLLHFEKSSETEFVERKETPVNPKTIALRTISGLVLTNINDIFGFEYSSDTHCWSVILKGQEKEIRLVKQITSKNLLSLNDKYIQINPNNIVNIDYINFIESNTYKCMFRPPFQNITMIASRRCYLNLKLLIDIM